MELYAAGSLRSTDVQISLERVRKPRGYPRTIFKSGFDITKYLCGVCLLVLTCPVQTFCGHRFCEECLLAYIQLQPEGKCPKCLEEGEDERIGPSNPDFAIRREMARLATMCVNEGCDWTGDFQEYIKHEAGCHFKVKDCPFGCDCLYTPAHQQTSLSTHLLSLLHTVLNLQDGPNLNANKTQFDNLSDRISRQEGTLLSLKTKLEELENQTREGLENEEANYNMTAFSLKQKEVESMLAILNRQLEKVLVGYNALVHERRLKDELMKTLQTKCEQLARSLSLKEVKMADQSQRIEALEYTTYNGILVWPITGVEAKRRQAMQGQTTSIYSPCFYSSQNGYKMCLRLYLNGDGMGKATHISVFFVLKRSQYDAILTFPFRSKVTIKLLNQLQKEDIVEAFRPDPNSSSFKRPVSDMNIGSGCPLFCPLDKLEPREGFLKDDTIFIKAIVDQV